MDNNGKDRSMTILKNHERTAKIKLQDIVYDNNIVAVAKQLHTVKAGSQQKTMCTFRMLC